MGASHGAETKAKVWRDLILIVVAFLFFLAGIIWKESLQQTPGGWAEYAVFGIAYVILGWEIFLRAWRGILRGRPFDENFLMTIATIGAIAIHQLPEAVAVFLFYRAGDWLEGLAIKNTRRSVRRLLELKPELAHVQRDGAIIDLRAEKVSVGAVVLIRPGEKVPLDGTVLEGKSQVDTSALTGESVPRGVGAGDPVLAGMINKGGLLTIEVTRRFEESSIAKILYMVEHASAKKASAERFITKIARYYTPVVVALAILLAFVPPVVLSQPFSKWIYRALVLLVISCPCGLVISIPLGYFGGIGGAAKRGILIKGSTYLDALRAVKTMVFDKTGTLTKANFKVVDRSPQNGFTETELLAFAAKAEHSSNHPLALSIREAYGEAVDPKDIGDYEEIPGQGIRATVEGRQILVGNDRLLHAENIEHNVCHLGGTVSHVAVDGVYAGFLVIADEVRDESLGLVSKLKSLGVESVWMLTGDNQDVAKKVAQEVGLDGYAAQLLPEDKVAEMEKLLAKRRPNEALAFVGDGVNDAPVIARADVGIAMGGLGSDAAIETADVVILTDDPAKTVDAMQISRRTRRIVLENIIFALSVKGILVALGAFGEADLWEAIFADVGVALLAILNATRMLR